MTLPLPPGKKTSIVNGGTFFKNPPLTMELFANSTVNDVVFCFFLCYDTTRSQPPERNPWRDRTAVRLALRTLKTEKQYSNGYRLNEERTA